MPGRARPRSISEGLPKHDGTSVVVHRYMDDGDSLIERMLGLRSVKV